MTMDQGDPVLVFRQVSVRYDAAAPPALADCTFAVGAGERVALIGANGSGKTTILTTTVGLVPCSGDVIVAGERLDYSRPEAAHAHVGLLFSIPEDQLLFPRVLDDVAFSLTGRGVPSAEAERRALEVLGRLGAADLAERSPYRMSRGQRLRAALAGTLVTEPPLLLLDEPSSGLDPAGRRLLIQQLNGLPSAMLIATHDIDFAARCCHRWLLMDAGRVAAAGTDFTALEL
jgi:cobalt/nickel transport system ATP-binding protein